MSGTCLRTINRENLTFTLVLRTDNITARRIDKLMVGRVIPSVTQLELSNRWIGRGFDSLEFFIDIILPVALWPWG